MSLSFEERRALFPDLPAREVVRLTWAREELIATAEARERLQLWADAGMPIADPSQVAFIGDESIRALVVRTLRRLPPPVVHHITSNVLVVAIGHGELGWCSSAPPARPQIIALNTHALADDEPDLESVFAHEGAHAFLESGIYPARESVEKGLAQQNNLVHLATQWQMLGRVSFPVEKKERLAAALARSWGFEGSGTDVRACSRLARRRVLTESKEKS